MQRYLKQMNSRVVLIDLHPSHILPVNKARTCGIIMTLPMNNLKWLKNMLIHKSHCETNSAFYAFCIKQKTHFKYCICFFYIYCSRMCFSTAQKWLIFDWSGLQLCTSWNLHMKGQCTYQMQNRHRISPNFELIGFTAKIRLIRKV